MQYGGNNIRNYTQYFLHLVLFSLCAFLETVFVLRVLLSSTLCLFVVNVCVLVVLVCICCTSYVYLLYYVCITVITSDARLLARSQYPEGPATGHLNTGFCWVPCV